MAKKSEVLIEMPEFEKKYNLASNAVLISIL